MDFTRGGPIWNWSVFLAGRSFSISNNYSKNKEKAEAKANVKGLSDYRTVLFTLTVSRSKYYYFFNRYTSGTCPFRAVLAMLLCFLVTIVYHGRKQDEEV